MTKAPQAPTTPAPAGKTETYVLSVGERNLIVAGLMKLETNEAMHLAGKLLDATAVALARSATH